VTDSRIKLFRPTVARPDTKPGSWLLMNRPDKGYSELAYPFPSLEAIVERYAVVLGERGEDKHGPFVRVNLATEGGAPPAAPLPPPPVARDVAPRVTAFSARHDGGRRRTFDVGPFSVVVEPHEDDAAQAAFTAALALAAADIVRGEEPGVTS
jgi:hypothetical protein